MEAPEEGSSISEEEHHRVVSSLLEDYRYSTSKFDNLSVAMAGGALGFSLTFIKDIVPFKDSNHIWLFYVALGLFIFSLMIGFVAHLASMQITSKALLKVLKRNYNISPSKPLTILNWVIASTVSLGVITLVLYCAINIQILRDEHNAKPPASITTSEALKKKIEFKR